MSFANIAKLTLLFLIMLAGMFWVLDKHYEAEDEFHQALLAQFEVGMPYQDFVVTFNAFGWRKIGLVEAESHQNLDGLTLEPINIDFEREYGRLFHSLTKKSFIDNGLKANQTALDETRLLIYSMWTTAECVLLLGFSNSNSDSQIQPIPDKLQLADVRCR